MNKIDLINGAKLLRSYTPNSAVDQDEEVVVFVEPGGEQTDAVVEVSVPIAAVLSR